RSGWSESDMLTASSPDAASPTSSNSEIRLRTARAAARNGGWSSTTNTCTIASSALLLARLRIWLAEEMVTDRCVDDHQAGTRATVGLSPPPHAGRTGLVDRPPGPARLARSVEHAVLLD